MLVRPRLLPAVLGATALLLVFKLDAVLRGVPAARVQLVAVAQAGPEPAAPPPQPATGTPATVSGGGPQRFVPGAEAAAVEPTPEQRAERQLLEGLRARRAAIDARDAAVVQREMMLAAAERRLGDRIEALTALQARLEAAERTRGEREDAGWRGMVKLYEGMRPRDAATIFDELEMPVLVNLVDRMREAKAAPVLGAMRPERARLLTAELARHRARPAD